MLLEEDSEQFQAEFKLLEYLENALSIYTKYSLIRSHGPPKIDSKNPRGNLPCSPEVLRYLKIIFDCLFQTASTSACI